MGDKMNSLSESLVTARKNAGYSIVQASDLSGVPLEEMQEIETQNVQPDVLDLRRLSVLYGCSFQVLMGKTDYSDPA